MPDFCFLRLLFAIDPLPRVMIYDVNSPQYQAFLRSGRRREEGAYQSGTKGAGANVKMVHKPGGAASTGL